MCRKANKVQKYEYIYVNTKMIPIETIPLIGVGVHKE
jgi:hypothetical protein